MNTGDQCLDTPHIKAIHHAMGERGLQAVINDLAERQPSLIAYVFCSGIVIAERACTAGVPREQVPPIEHEIVFRMLVAIESIRTAHYELWRDLMGDEPVSSEPEGDQHV